MLTPPQCDRFDFKQKPEHKLYMRYYIPLSDFLYQIRFFKFYESLTTEVAAKQTKPAYAGSMKKGGKLTGFGIT
ncbi:MAG TPA: hypothetical protein V6C91_05690 [Coleofasciculaceae cyanobacterium]